MEGWADSDILTVEYTKVFTHSTLEILDENRQPLDYLTDPNSSFTVLITAAEAGLTSVHPVAVTTANGDTDTLTLVPFGREGDMFRFMGLIPFAVDPEGATSGNGTVEAWYFDSVIVTWVNPNDPADVVSDTVAVRPHPRPAAVYFTDTLAISDPVYIYEEEVDSVTIIVQDQVGNPDLDYQITLITDPLYGDRDPDTLTVDLIELSPGVYGVRVPVDNTSLITNPGDQELQVLKGDTIYAFYTDPLDEETQRARVVYSKPGEVEGVMYFTDAQWNQLADGVVWDPREDNLYIYYQDDYLTTPKALTVTVTSTLGTGAVRYDTLQLALDLPEQQDSIGIWRITLAMLEEEWPDTRNDTVEVFFKGEVRAQIPTHARDGTDLNTIQDLMMVARPDSQEVIIVTDTAGNDTIYRSTEIIRIEVNDQDFTNATDTILVNVYCPATNDVLEDVMLIQQPDGSYVGTFQKDEIPVDLNDRILSTPSEGLFEVVYVDPVYGNQITKEVSFIDTSPQNIYFTDPNGNVITSMDEYTDSTFVVVVEAASENKYQVDTLQVILTTQGGDQDTILVIETDIHSGVFESAELTFSFGEPNPDNNVVEVPLDTSSSHNIIDVTATVITPQGTNSTDMVIESAYIPVDSTWIIDGNSDGYPDSIFIQFQEPLGELPMNIYSIDWPEEAAGSNITARYNEDSTLTQISFYVREDGTVDSSLVVVYLGEQAFDFGATAPDPDDPPSLTLPEGPVFRGMEILIEDRIKPVIVDAVMYPSDPDILTPDTLVVTLSEPITQTSPGGAPWNNLIMFYTPGNEDQVYVLQTYDNMQPIVSDDGLTWTFIVTDEIGVFKPQIGDVVFLNPYAEYADAENNETADREEDVIGEAKKNPIHTSYITVPVIGLSPSSPGYVQVNGYYDEDGNWVVDMPTWIPPYGMDFYYGTINEDEQALCEEDPSSVVPERKGLTPVPPNCLSMVSVLSDTSYIAYVDIYDNLGKVVHSSVQRFGLCGELYNSARYTPSGKISWLIWNQMDLDEKFVGSGVYIWQVQFKVRNRAYIEYYKQGVVRAEEDPLPNCAAPQ
jgi:hypothetical protein